MRLISVELDYFLKHEHLKVSLEPGVNIVRGKNEAGKSSFLEGIGYNLFGSALLAGTLEETLNWNAKSKSQLKTTTVFEHRGSTYTLVRGASGAELTNAAGILCTGHKEVTAYVEKLLGLPAGRSQHIVLANQNEIRGVLSLGPTAATEFIERLADFSSVDALIKKLSTELTTGPTTALEAQLVLNLEQQGQTIIPEVPNHSVEISQLEADIQVLNESIQSQQATYQQACANYNALADEYKRQAQAKQDLARRLQLLDAQLEQCRSQVGYDAIAVSELKGINQVLAQAADRRLYDRFQAFVTASAVEDVWDDTATFSFEVTAARQVHEEARQTASNLKGHLEVKQASLMAEGVCKTCGTVLTDPAKILEHNTRVEGEIAEIKKHLEKALEARSEGAAYIETLEALRKAQDDAERWVLTNDPSGQYVALRGNSVPQELAWISEVVPPELPVDEFELNKKAAELSQQINAGVEAAKQLPVLEAQRAGLQEQLTGVEDWLKVRVEPVQPTEPDLQNLREESSAKIQQAETLRTAVTVAQTNAKNAEQQLQRLKESAVLIEKTIKTQREDTVFLKAVKEARVLVAEKLWGLVMGGTSNYFSRLRGQSSVVVRTANGFAVDGKMSRPSGSTLDILGLALRITISKIFSDCGLTAIDEPSAGCDAERTLNMAAVVAGAGFEQVIWVSHQDIAEACAGHLIEL